MCGGAYLCYEGAHKIFHKLMPSQDHEKTPTVEKGKYAEDNLVKSAITTDLILSAEIMVISLNSLMDQTFWMRLVVLVSVAILITVVVYGSVGLLVKMDDIGLSMLRRRDGKSPLGSALVKGMPHVLTSSVSWALRRCCGWVAISLSLDYLTSISLNRQTSFTA